MIEIAESISSFSQASPSDQLITLTIGQLQDLIKQAVAEAIAPLEARIDVLEAHIATQGEEITALKENWREAKPLTTASRVDDLFDWVGEIDSKTTSQPATADRETAKSPRIDELYDHMKLTGLKQTTFAGAAKILKVTKQRVLQLKPAIAQDMRFIILPSQSHSQKLVIRLREYQEL